MALEINAVLEGLFPGSPGILLNKALILEDRAAALEKRGRQADRENAEALQAYETALSLEPVLPDTLFNAGFFFLRRNNFARARDCFSLYIAAGEKSEIPTDKKTQAEKIIKDLSGFDDSAFQEAYDCVNRGKDEEALVKIRGLIEKHPMVWNGWFLLGWTLRKLKRYRDGLDSLKKADELGGSNCDVKNETAICLMELGDLKGARKELEQALHEEPENIKIISNLGVLALKAGKREEADAFFRTVLELEPEDALARRCLEGEINN
jgi:cytochrome c-type biogenesis protein CcmH/NrfG